jgi:hypothetical protein
VAAPPTAFISYSWDSPEHKEWVAELGTRLRENGVDVRLDVWDVAPGDSLTQFMEAQIATCDFVVVICTPQYAARSQARQGGVGYEQQIISGFLAGGVPRRKFIPILRSGSFSPGPGLAIPTHFAGIYAIDFSDNDRAEANFEPLLRALFGIPAIEKPTLGVRPEFDSASAPELPQSLRLPSLEIEGWHLLSGVVSNQLYPTTFHIPSESERRAVSAGAVVKLSFELGVDYEDEPDIVLEGERMWVTVVGHDGPYLIGKLSNQPAAYSHMIDDERYEADEDAPLKHGDQVVFLPEHIIDIEEADEPVPIPPQLS